MVVFYQFQRQLQQAAAEVEESYRSRSEMRRLLTQVVNAETGIRGYLLTRRESFLEPYQAALREIPEIHSSLRRGFAGNVEQTKRLGRLEGLTRHVIEAMQRSREEVTLGNDEAAIEVLAADKAGMDALRLELDTMIAEAQRMLSFRTSELRRVERRTSAVIFAGGALGLLGGVVAVLIFMRRIAFRVKRLELEAREVAAGGKIIADVTGDDEIARLEHTLKETSELITERTAELSRARDELESRVRERTAELSKANEELRSSNAVRQAVIRSSPLAIWAVDLDGNVTFWNPAAERIFGWTEADTLGQRLPVIPEGDWPEYQEWLTRFANGEVLSGVERKRRRKDGTEIDVLLWTAPLFAGDGSIRGAIAIDSDISQQKLLEEQFRQSQKLEAVGRLAGGVAHDFNNLLTVIQGYSEMIGLEAEGAAPKIVDFTKEIDYAAGRASALTAQLLAFSRRQISQPKTLDLNEVVVHSMKLLKRVIGEDIEVGLHLDPNLHRVRVDPIHMDQVIMNLVVNARDAMGGGGRLSIETSNQRLDADYAGRHIGVQPGMYCQLAISDTGSGMTADTRSRLFEPFFTTKEAGKGTGLGLAIVYGIVKQNHGEITVYSEPGIGTTFKIYLPIVEAPAEIAAEERRALALRGTETVLLCEDETQIRELVERMLKRQGYRVITAETPDEAVRIARREPFDLLLTDLVMPKMSGFDLARDVAAARPGAKVLYMSGYTDTQITRGLEISENTPFLQKPFTAAALSAMVRRVLEDPTNTTSRGALPSPSRG
jgi:PAS domain S-box-containing protein